MIFFYEAKKGIRGLHGFRGLGEVGKRERQSLGGICPRAPGKEAKKYTLGGGGRVQFVLKWLDTRSVPYTPLTLPTISPV